MAPSHSTESRHRVTTPPPPPTSRRRGGWGGSRQRSPECTEGAVGLTSVQLARDSAVSAPAREAAEACSRSLLGASEGDVSVCLRPSQTEFIGVYRPIYPGQVYDRACKSVAPEERWPLYIVYINKARTLKKRIYETHSHNHLRVYACMHACMHTYIH